jgi:alpha-L-rhamnosidase
MVAPFIWTSTQLIDPAGFTATFMGRPRRDDGKNRWFLFRRSFDVDAMPAEAITRITADGRYQLFVNGQRVARGPVRCTPLDQKYDEVDIAPYLVPGRNVIGAIVHVFGQDKSWYECVKGMWQPTFGDGAFWVDGPFGATDLDWRCIECAAWDNLTPEANHGLANIESFDARAFTADWLGPDFDDAQWDSVHILESGGGGPEAPFGGITTRPFPQLGPSGIPLLAEEFVPAQRLVWASGLVPQTDLPIADRAYGEPLIDLAAGSVNESGGSYQIAASTPVMLMFDFERLHTGTVTFEIDAAEGTEIEIAVSEQVPGEWQADGPAPLARIVPRRTLGFDAHVTRYVAREGQQRFERFIWQAVKWMQVSVRNASAQVTFRQLGVIQTNYPVELKGRFASSDPLLNQLWATGAETLKLCMHDGWEDCPSREQRQWLGDATVEQLVGQATFGPAVNALNAKFLKDAAASQRPDGLTQMFAPGNHATNGLLIPDWTLQWILNARNHLLWSGDLATIEEVMPAIERALAWFLRLRGANGLVADMPYWHFMDWAGLGREGEACTLNAQLAGCLDAAAKLADAVERPKLARDYRAAASEIRAALNTRHWDEARGVYVDCVDPISGAQKLRVSQHANAAMILWGNAPQERWSRMIERITDPTRLTFTAAPPIAPTGETLDLQAGVVLANTFYSHFVYEALVKAGHAPAALSLMRRFYGPMLEKGATTLWESFAPTASLCHGFSASPTYHLLTGLLGLQPEGDGFRALRIAPQPGEIAQLSGTLPTLHGPIHASITTEPDGFAMTAELPASISYTIGAPPGYRLTQERLQGSTLHLQFRID